VLFYISILFSYIPITIPTPIMSATLRQRAPSPVGQGVSEKAALIKEEEIKEAKDGKQ
jgi:hypothetical protein